MGKLKYVVVLAISAVIYAGCSKKAQITGPQGATGAQGVQGGMLEIFCQLNWAHQI